MKCLSKGWQVICWSVQRFDDLMNVMLKSCTEYRRVWRHKDETANSPLVIKEETRKISSVVIRDKHIVKVSVVHSQQLVLKATPK